MHLASGKPVFVVVWSQKSKIIKPLDSADLL
jgi:hypothetical protein